MASTTCTMIMMMMSISPFGHKAVGDLSGRRDVFTSIAHILHSGFLAIYFVKVKWYLLINSFR
jgi:hypothetical protein